jgi:hypothetical protein
VQLEHTTLPKREHGHKQLGKAAAASHVAQLASFFLLGTAAVMAAWDLPGQGRVVFGTMGIAYALQVRGRVSEWGWRVHPDRSCWTSLCHLVHFLVTARLHGDTGRQTTHTLRSPRPSQATRLVMAHMAKEPYSIAAWPMVALALQATAPWLVPATGADPMLLSWSLNLVVTAGYLHYVVSVVRQVAAFLGIYALTIKRAMPAAKAA